MKAVILGTAIAIASTGAMAKGWGKEMRGLDLSDQQKIELMELRATHEAAMAPVRAQHMAEIRALLTPEQQEKFDQRMAKMAEKMAKRKAKMEKRRQQQES